MDEEGRLEKCIIEFININGRSTAKRALGYARKHYKGQVTQQKISRRMFYLADKGVLQKLTSAGVKGPYFIIKEGKKDESDQG